MPPARVHERPAGRVSAAARGLDGQSTLPSTRAGNAQSPSSSNFNSLVLRDDRRSSSDAQDIGPVETESHVGAPAKTATQTILARVILFRMLPRNTAAVVQALEAIVENRAGEGRSFDFEGLSRFHARTGTGKHQMDVDQI